MRWQGRRQSSNVEDRRGSGGGFGRMGSGGPRIRIPMGGGRGGGGGGLGIGAIVVILVIAWATGINPLSLLGGLGGGPIAVSPSGSQTSGSRGAPSDDHGAFIATVLAETENTWKKIFAEHGAQYEEPVLVLFSGSTQSACGFAQSAMGPFYCPGDNKVYIDLSFYEELRTRFKASGDFAEAYVIAHEVGHHVQNLLGTLGEVNRLRQQSDQARSNELSIRIELQADCYAGIWARSVDDQGLLDVEDIEEALNAAAQIGDDAIQKRTQGYVVPESFNHGTSAQRVRWFKQGYERGTVEACDTFAARSL